MDALNSFNWWWMGAVEEDIHGRVKHHVLVLDHCLEQHLLQFSAMASLYCKLVSLVLLSARDTIPDHIEEEFHWLVKTYVQEETSRP